MKQRDIDRLCAEGGITPEQSAAVAAHFHLAEPRPHRWLLLPLALTAGGLILLGIIMPVYAHWESLTPELRMGGGCLLLLACWGLYALLYRSRPVTAEFVAFAAVGIWLADILLYGESYAVRLPFEKGCFIFFCGIVLLPFVLRQRLLIGVVSVTSMVLWVSTCYAARGSDRLFHAAEIGQFCLALFWWAFGEYCRGHRSWSGYHWLSYVWFPVVAFLSVGAYEVFLDGYRAIVLPVAVLLVLPLLRRMPSRAWWLLLTAVLLLCTQFVLTSRNAGVTSLLLFGSGCAFMAAGAAASRRAWVNFGTLVLYFSATMLMALVSSPTGGGVMLILMGGVLLAVVVVLEKQRRRLIRAIQNKTESTHE